MAEAGLFIGWGNAVRGREREALKVFGEAAEFFGRLQQEGGRSGSAATDPLVAVSPAANVAQASGAAGARCDA